MRAGNRVEVAKSISGRNGLICGFPLVRLGLESGEGGGVWLGWGEKLLRTV